MWTYILRRLLIMLPTLFGVTVVSFCIMQLAPGDPLRNQLGSSGLSGQSGQTREAYLIQKRDLKLDKPLVLNFNYFRDYSPLIRTAVHWLGGTDAQILAELDDLVKSPEKPANVAKLAFLRTLGIADFDTRLHDAKDRPKLVPAIRGLVQINCEDAGRHGVATAVAILGQRDADPRQKLGAIHALNSMVVEPFRYTYSHRPTDAETPLVVTAWKTWWQRAAAGFPALGPGRRAAVEARFARIAAAGSRGEVFEGLNYIDPATAEPFRRADMRVFIEKLVAEEGDSPIFVERKSGQSPHSSSLAEKVVASLGLRLYLGKPLATDVAAPGVAAADDQAPPPEAEAATPARLDDQIREVAENWQVQFELNRATYEPGILAKTGYIFTDTQYAHMVWRLVTFQFGRSTLKTREPVSTKIVNAMLVSAPLMILAEFLIYLISVPLGILCAVRRGQWTDRAISLGLFVLYSIPAVVAGMLLLLFLCYGRYLAWFPMDGLHSDAADDYGFLMYAVDYLWHIIVPVACLSLFSLAVMAMYSRTSMLDVISQDYIRTARAKGLSEEKVILKHGLRNALIPIITLFSNFLPAMLGGSVLIEYLFGIPGMGQLSWSSIELKDFPTLMALTYLEAILVMISILMSDILYVLVDPRISFEAQGTAA